MHTPSPEFTAANERRIDLINKKYADNSLTEAEADELDRLQKYVEEYLAVHAPVPKLSDEEKSLLEKLKEKL